MIIIILNKLFAHLDTTVIVQKGLFALQELTETLLDYLQDIALDYAQLGK